ncbi:Hypothetical predicted protein [Mytilus galloprovincialis]|uniref:Uncharacterized protein n=1 Tax=Mytilus galloprovincialis TaxID=29158 RepID=A0A8B6GKW4_MYTGA|nr:Hypothetical predicted protein [Mytilus galloprovincialis]
MMHFDSLRKFIVVFYSSSEGNVYAGSCYYEHTDPTYYTSTYEYCLAGCCGADKLGGLKHCCNSTGATIGIVIAIVVFVALVLTALYMYRRRRRRLLLAGSTERDRLSKNIYQ